MASSSCVAGGSPRPSFRWQSWQARALKSGPSPSEALVEDGADTQALVKSPLPRLKVIRPSSPILAEGSEKASAVGRARTVAAPAGFASNLSGAEKSRAGAVTAAMRAASAAVRGKSGRCRSLRSPASALARGGAAHKSARAAAGNLRVRVIGRLLPFLPASRRLPRRRPQGQARSMPVRSTATASPAHRRPR